MSGLIARWARLSTLAASAGASLIGFIQSGAGAVARTLQAKARDVVSVKDFGAVGDGVTDDTAAIQAAVDSFAAEAGGRVIFPQGVYLVSATVTASRRVTLSGAGFLEESGVAVFAGTKVIKKSTAVGPVFALTAPCCVVENMAIVGEAGNAGDGIQISAALCVVRNVAVMKMGQDGIRLGTDAVGVNANLWTLDAVFCRENVRYGVHLHDDSTGAQIDCNAGTALRLSCQSNGSHGLYVNNAHKNTFVGLHTETNTGYGLYLAAGSQYNTFVGGDQEGNTAGNVFQHATASWTNLIGIGSLTGVATHGRTSMWGYGTVTQLANAAGEVLGNGAVGGSFAAGQSNYIALRGDSNDRIRVGWAFDGVTAGLVPAQILHNNAHALELASRDVAAGSVKIRAGTGIPVIATFDSSGAKMAGAFGCNTKAPQGAYASGGALSAYATGAFGFDTEPHAAEVHAMLVKIRAALVANGIMS